MADNVRGGSSSGSNPLVSADEVTYSGDSSKVQLMRPVHVSGSEGSKTVEDVTVPYGVKTILNDPNTDSPIAVNGDSQLVVAAYVLDDFGDPIPGDASNGLDVDVTRLPAAPANSGVDIGDVTINNGAGASAVNIQDGGNVITVDGTVAVTQSGTWDEVGINDSGNSITVDAPTGTPVAVQIGNATLTAGVIDETGASAVDALAVGGGTAHDAVDSGNPQKIGGYAKAAVPSDVSADGDRVNAWFLRNGAQATVLTAAGALVGGDASNGLDVDVTRLPALVAGTAYVGKVRLTDGTLDSNLVDETGSSAVDALAVGGGTPHDSVDSGNPVKQGFKAKSAFPTAVANNDRADGISDLWGRQLVSHIDPALAIHKSFNATSTQTGIDVWDPAGGMRIAVTSVVIGTYGTTAARIILWFGDNADTTYTAGTDQLLLAFSAAPSASSKPGLVFTPAFPVFCTTADRELHITTDAGISIDVAVEGYEW